MKNGKKHPKFFRSLLIAACALGVVAAMIGVGYSYYIGTTDRKNNPLSLDQHKFQQLVHTTVEMEKAI